MSDNIVDRSPVEGDPRVVLPADHEAERGDLTLLLDQHLTATGAREPGLVEPQSGSDKA